MSLFITAFGLAAILIASLIVIVLALRSAIRSARRDIVRLAQLAPAGHPEREQVR